MSSISDAQQSAVADCTVSVNGRIEPGLLKHDVYFEMLNREIDRIGPDATVLDVGCGLEDSPRLEKMQAFSQRVAHLWGVEPDTSGKIPEHFEKSWPTTLEDADVPDSSVDLLISFFVIEHVTHPDEFMQHVERILKPGGVFISATVNLNCVFARVAKTSQTFGFQDQLLSMLLGKKRVDEYHYPAYYLMNTVAAYQQLAAKTQAFQQIELDFLENDEWYHYLPRPIRGTGGLLRSVFHRRPENYSYLFVRMA